MSGAANADWKELVDVDYLLQNIEECRELIKTLRGKRLIGLLGESGAGKTTTMYHLAKKPLTYRTIRCTYTVDGEDFSDEEDRIDLVNPKECEFKIGHTKSSCTSKIQLIKIDEKTVLCDTPGFLDTNYVRQSVVNSVLIYKTLMACHSVHPVVIFNAAHLDPAQKGRTFVDHLESLINFLPLHLVEKHVHLFFTHVQRGKNHKRIIVQLHQIQQSLREDSHEYALLKTLIQRVKDMKDSIIIQPVVGDVEQQMSSSDELMARITTNEHLPALEEKELIQCPLDTDARKLIKIISQQISANAIRELKNLNFNSVAKCLEKSKMLMEIPLEALEQAHEAVKREVTRKAEDLVQTTSDYVDNKNYGQTARMLDTLVTGEKQLGSYTSGFKERKRILSMLKGRVEFLFKTVAENNKKFEKLVLPLSHLKEIYNHLKQKLPGMEKKFTDLSSSLREVIQENTKALEQNVRSLKQMPSVMKAQKDVEHLLEKIDELTQNLEFAPSVNKYLSDPCPQSLIEVRGILCKTMMETFEHFEMSVSQACDQIKALSEYLLPERKTKAPPTLCVFGKDWKFEVLRSTTKQGLLNDEIKMLDKGRWLHNVLLALKCRDMTRDQRSSTRYSELKSRLVRLKKEFENKIVTATSEQKFETSGTLCQLMLLCGCIDVEVNVDVCAVLQREIGRMLRDLEMKMDLVLKVYQKKLGDGEDKTRKESDVIDSICDVSHPGLYARKQHDYEKISNCIIVLNGTTSFDNLFAALERSQEQNARKCGDSDLMEADQKHFSSNDIQEALTKIRATARDIGEEVPKNARLQDISDLINSKVSTEFDAWRKKIKSILKMFYEEVLQRQNVQSGILPSGANDNNTENVGQYSTQLSSDLLCAALYRLDTLYPVKQHLEQYEHDTLEIVNDCQTTLQEIIKKEALGDEEKKNGTILLCSALKLMLRLDTLSEVEKVVHAIIRLRMIKTDSKRVNELEHLKQHGISQLKNIAQLTIQTLSTKNLRSSQFITEIVQSQIPDENTSTHVKRAFETLKDNMHISDVFSNTKVSQAIEVHRVSKEGGNKLQNGLREAFRTIRDKVRKSIYRKKVSKATERWMEIINQMSPIQIYFKDLDVRKIIIDLSNEIETAVQETDKKLQLQLSSKDYKGFIASYEDAPNTVKELGDSMAKAHLNNLKKTWTKEHGIFAAHLKFSNTSILNWNTLLTLRDLLEEMIRAKCIAKIAKDTAFNQFILESIGADDRRGFNGLFQGLLVRTKNLLKQYKLKDASHIWVSCQWFSDFSICNEDGKCLLSFAERVADFRKSEICTIGVKLEEDISRAIGEAGIIGSSGGRTTKFADEKASCTTEPDSEGFSTPEMESEQPAEQDKKYPRPVRGKIKRKQKKKMAKKEPKLGQEQKGQGDLNFSSLAGIVKYGYGTLFNNKIVGTVQKRTTDTSKKQRKKDFPRDDGSKSRNSRRSSERSDLRIMEAIEAKRLRIKHVNTKRVLDCVRDAHQNNYFPDAGIFFLELEESLKLRISNWISAVHDALRHLQIRDSYAGYDYIIPELKLLAEECQLASIGRKLQQFERSKRAYEENIVLHGFDWDERNMQQRAEALAKKLITVRFEDYVAFDKLMQRLKKDRIRPRFLEIKNGIVRGYKVSKDTPSMLNVLYVHAKAIRNEIGHLIDQYSANSGQCKREMSIFEDIFFELLGLFKFCITHHLKYASIKFHNRNVHEFTEHYEELQNLSELLRGKPILFAEDCKLKSWDMDLRKAMSDLGDNKFLEEWEMQVLKLTEDLKGYQKHVQRERKSYSAARMYLEKLDLLKELDIQQLNNNLSTLGNPRIFNEDRTHLGSPRQSLSPYSTGSGSRWETDKLITLIQKSSAKIAKYVPLLLEFGENLDAKKEETQRACLNDGKRLIRNLKSIVAENIPRVSEVANRHVCELRKCFVDTWDRLKTMAEESLQSLRHESFRDVLQRIKTMETKLGRVVQSLNGSSEVLEKFIEHMNSDIKKFGEPESAPSAHETAQFLSGRYDQYSKLENKFVNQKMKDQMAKLLHNLESKGLDLVSLGNELGNAEEYPNGDLLIKGIPQLKFVQTRRLNIQLKKAHVTVEAALQMMEDIKSNAISKEERTFLRERYDQYEKKFVALRKRYLVNDHHGLVDIVLSSATKIKSTGEKDWSQVLSRMPTFLAEVCAVWSIQHSKRIYLQTNDKMDLIEPHPVQILTMFRFLGLGYQAQKGSECLWRNSATYQIQNHLCQVVTGGGKSIILGLTSTILALLGFTVHCACYSKILSERDHNSFKDFWELLNVQSKITFSTMDSLAETCINENGNVREMTEKLFEGKLIPSRTQRKKSSRKILLFDEVDVFFQKDFFGITYNPVTALWREDMKSLMGYAWESRASLDSTKLNQRAEFQNLATEFGSVFASKLIGEILEGLQCLSTHNYVATSAGRIGYKEHGSVSTNTFDGYTTAFCYLQELERKNPNFQRSYVEKIMGNITIPCGNFSFAELPKNYAAILGVTGTLESISECESKVIIQDIYKIKHTTITPSIYGETDCIFEEANHIKILKEKCKFHQEIQKSIRSNVVKQRATLVFFRTSQAMRDFETSEQGLTFISPRLKVIDEECENIDAAVVKATTLDHAATLFPRVFGRGLDFKNRDAKMENGVHVIQAFFSDTVSEEVQIKGRTARQGDKGSYEIIALVSDVTEDFKLEESQLMAESKSSKTNLYNLIKRTRLQSIQEDLQKRIKLVETCGEKHQMSMKYIDALAKGDKKKADSLHHKIYD